MQQCRTAARLAVDDIQQQTNDQDAGQSSPCQRLPHAQRGSAACPPVLAPAQNAANCCRIGLAPVNKENWTRCPCQRQHNVRQAGSSLHTCCILGRRLATCIVLFQVRWFGDSAYLLDPLGHVLLINVVGLVPVRDQHHLCWSGNHMSPAFSKKQHQHFLMGRHSLGTISQRCEWHSLKAKLLKGHHGPLQQTSGNGGTLTETWQQLAAAGGEGQRASVWVTMQRWHRPSCAASTQQAASRHRDLARSRQS